MGRSGDGRRHEHESRDQGDFRRHPSGGLSLRRWVGVVTAAEFVGFLLPAAVGAITADIASVIAARISRVVEQLDETVREIRTSIFDLHTAGQEGPTSARRRFMDAITETAADSGITPTVRMSGPVDTLVPPSVAEHAEAVVREAVSNAIRHAAPTSVVVTVEAGDDLVIDVVDDGTGLPEHFARSGLANLERRASTCEGTLTLAPGTGGGTRLTWRVPLP